MPNLERGGFGYSVDNLSALGARLGLGGVVLPGSMGYDTFPTAANPTTVTTGASANTLGSDATLVGSSAITVPYFFCGLALSYFKSGQVNAPTRYQIKTGSTVIRTASFMLLCDGVTATASWSYWYPVNPYLCPANNTLLAANTSDSSNTSLGVPTYALVLRKPVTYLPLLSPTGMNVVATDLPNDVTGIAPANGGGTWTYGAYSQISAGIATPILITRVAVDISTTNNHIQVSLATGAAASEVDFATFGAPVNTGQQVQSLVYDLPYPVLIDSNTRLAARSRANTTSGSSRMWLQYVALPTISRGV